MKPNTATASNEAFVAVDDGARIPGPAARLILVLLAGYKLLLSPYFAGSCRFLPSCADYARDAVYHHGAVAGGWLALRRLARCHPLCEGGHDPVPSTARRRREEPTRLIETAR